MSYTKLVVLIFFAENVLVEDVKTLKRVLQHVNPDQEEKELINADLLEYQKRQDNLIRIYASV